VFGAKVAEHRTAVAFERRHDLDDALGFQLTANRARPHHVSEIINAARGKRQSVGGHRQPARICNCCHLDRGLRSVKKRVEHLRVHPRGLCLRGGQSIVLPDVVRGHRHVGRQVLCALSGGGDRETCAARPIDHLGDERGLVAVGHGIDDARLARLVGQQRPSQNVRLHVHHHDMLARLDRGERMRDASAGVAGRFDDNLGSLIRAGVKAAGGEPGAGDALLVPTDSVAGSARAIRVEVSDQ
jgi:hypothetical protein